jgi:hypothetical protein
MSGLVKESPVVVALKVGLQLLKTIKTQMIYACVIPLEMSVEIQRFKFFFF